MGSPIERTRETLNNPKTLENRRFYADCFHPYFTIANPFSAAPKQVQNRVPNGVREAGSATPVQWRNSDGAILFFATYAGLLRL